MAEPQWERTQNLAQRAKQQGKAMASQQKDAAADRMGSTAQALHQTADDLSQGQHPQAGRYVGFAAEQLEDLSRRLRDTDLDGLIAEAGALSRRSPLAFFAGSVAAGFLVSRFMKSSGERRHAERGAELGSGTVRWRPSDDPTHQDLLDPGDVSDGAYADTAYRREAEPYVVDGGAAGTGGAPPHEASPFPTASTARDFGGRHEP